MPLLIPTHLLGHDGALCGKIPVKAVPASVYHSQRPAEPEPPVCGWCTLVYSFYNERIQDMVQAETDEALNIMRGGHYE